AGLMQARLVDRLALVFEEIVGLVAEAFDDVVDHGKNAVRREELSRFRAALERHAIFSLSKIFRRGQSLSLPAFRPPPSNRRNQASAGGAEDPAPVAPSVAGVASAAAPPSASAGLGMADFLPFFLPWPGALGGRGRNSNPIFPLSLRIKKASKKRFVRFD